MFHDKALFLFEMLSQKRHDFVAVDVNPRLFAERVVAAWNGGAAVFDLVAAESVDRVA